MTQETYMPSEGEVRRAYASYMTLNGVHAGSVVVHHFLSEGKLMEFNRWLSAHDAQIRAESWDEGHQRGWIDGVENAESASPNPYRRENRLYKSNGLQSKWQKQ